MEKNADTAPAQVSSSPTTQPAPFTPSAPTASESLLAFLAPGIDRPDFILQWLSTRGVPARILELAGKRHVIVRFPVDSYDPNFRTKILVAHHDRAEGSPGANDNSAACFQLMQLAERLASTPLIGVSGTGRTGKGEPAAMNPGGARWKGMLRKTHNTIILFTDGEEAAGTGGIRAQGSFAIGSGLKTLGLDDADVYVFDACGRGDVLVLSEAGQPNATERHPTRGFFRLAPGTTGTSAASVSIPRARNTASALLRKNAELRDRARDMARESAAGKWITLLTPYSDNAGFLAAGIAAQVITVLPQTEADTLLFALAGKGDGITGKQDIAALERLVTANAHTRESDTALSMLIPETWRLMHGDGDNAATLTTTAFTLMTGFLDCLAANLDPL